MADEEEKEDALQRLMAKQISEAEMVEKGKEVVNTFILAIVSVPALLALQGVVLSHLWGWLVVPTLHTPPISIFGATGLALVGRAMIGLGRQPSDPKETLFDVVRKAIFFQGLFLLLGWLIHLFL